jgi:DNA-binding transcriptional ArsR family regulator
MSKYRITEIDELMAEFCHATSSPRRSMLIRILSHGERTASELSTQTGFSPANVSQHLKVLRDKRIVAVLRQGGRARYRLLQPKILAAMELMREAFLECLEGRNLDVAVPEPSPSGDEGQSGTRSGGHGRNE